MNIEWEHIGPGWPTMPSVILTTLEIDGQLWTPTQTSVSQQPVVESDPTEHRRYRCFMILRRRRSGENR